LYGRSDNAQCPDRIRLALIVFSCWQRCSLNIYEIKSISSSPAPLFSHKPAFALNSNYFKNDSLMRLSNIFIFSDTRKVNSSLIFPFYDYRSFLLPQKFGLTD
jgi:hypothetical protein